MQADGAQAGVKEDQKYYGHDMTDKVGEVGCRLMTYNTQGKCGIETGGRMHLEDILDFIEQMGVDIAVLTDPGEIKKKTATIRRKVQERQWTAIIKTEGAAKAEGLIIIMTGDWRTVYDDEHSVEGK